MAWPGCIPVSMVARVPYLLPPALPQHSQIQELGLRPSKENVSNIFSSFPYTEYVCRKPLAVCRGSIKAQKMSQRATSRKGAPSAKWQMCGKNSAPAPANQKDAAEQVNQEEPHTQTRSRQCFVTWNDTRKPRSEMQDTVN